MDDLSEPLLNEKCFQLYDSDMDNNISIANILTPLHMNRPVYQTHQLNKETLYERPTTSAKKRWRRACSYIRPNAQCIKSKVPLLSWLPEYSWKNSFLGDIISGITVAIMHIPQGIAYGLLGNVPPVVGIYMAFFPVLAYTIFGTSRHVSIGTFAIVCLLTGKVVSQHATMEVMANGTALGSLPGEMDADGGYTNMQVAVTVTFTVACMQFIMCIFRLGIVTTLLSEMLVNGFTCAAAFHVVSSQLKDLLGLKITKRLGNFSFVLTLYDVYNNIGKANLAAITISLIACSILIFNNEVLKVWLNKKTKLPFPIELIAVVLGTMTSYFMSLKETYGISIVGEIPTGMPKFVMPAFDLMPSILLDSFVITMVSYTITMSMALIFARKVLYEVNSNQELLALSISNVTGSFFSCMPVTASLSRSMIQYEVGGVTQIASLVSCSILLTILLWIGPFFQTLPRCVLASIIVVALKGMILQLTSIVKYWRLSKWDGLVWIVTFTTTLIVQISYGLAAGVAVSLISIFMQGYNPHTRLLGVVPNTDLYLDLKRYKGTEELPHIKIWNYSGSLNFGTRSCFKDELCKRLGFDPVEVMRKRSKLQSNTYDKETSSFELLLPKCLIIDFSSVTFIDPSGVNLLRQIQVDFEKLDIVVYITCCSVPVYETISRCERLDEVKHKFKIFPTIHDAVLYAQSKVVNLKNI